MIIRPAASTDFNHLETFVWQAIFPAFDVEGLTDAQRAENDAMVEGARNEVLEALLADHQHVLVAIDPKLRRLAGYVVADARPRSYAELRTLVVKKTYWGKGVAADLLHAALDATGRHRPVSLAVRSFNDRARAFFVKHGFEDTGELAGEYAIPRALMIREAEVPEDRPVTESSSPTDTSGGSDRAPAGTPLVEDDFPTAADEPVFESLPDYRLSSESAPSYELPADHRLAADDDAPYSTGAHALTTEPDDSPLFEESTLDEDTRNELEDFIAKAKAAKAKPKPPVPPAPPTAASFEFAFDDQIPTTPAEANTFGPLGDAAAADEEHPPARPNPMRVADPESIPQRHPTEDEEKLERTTSGAVKDKISATTFIACPNCGTALPPEARFCYNCGTPQTSQMHSAPTGSPPGPDDMPVDLDSEDVLELSDLPDTEPFASPGSPEAADRPLRQGDPTSPASYKGEPNASAGLGGTVQDPLLAHGSARAASEDSAQAPDFSLAGLKRDFRDRLHRRLTRYFGSGAVGSYVQVLEGSYEFQQVRDSSLTSLLHWLKAHPTAVARHQRISLVQEDLVEYFLVETARDVHRGAFPQRLLRHQSTDWESVDVFQLVMDYLDFSNETDKVYTDFVTMPSRALKNATSSFLRAARDERILFICDQSLISQAKNGFAMTDAGLYWKNIFQPPGQALYKLMQPPTLGGGHLSIDGQFFDAGSSLNLKIALLLDKLRQLQG